MVAMMNRMPYRHCERHRPVAIHTLFCNTAADVRHFALQNVPLSPLPGYFFPINGKASQCIHPLPP
jgi:hypothetical protein